MRPRLLPLDPNAVRPSASVPLTSLLSHFHFDAMSTPPSRLYVNLYKQLKYLILGSLCLYVTRTDLTLRDLYLVHSSLTWPARLTLALSATCLAASIALFAAVMIMGGRGAVQQGKVSTRDHAVNHTLTPRAARLLADE